jgi:DNA-binding HxlR family transcriptional regulator
MRTRASSINRALDQLGDKWCLLILQEIFWGVNTFNDLQSVSGMSRGVLSQRLVWLQDIDCLKKVPEPNNARRSVYHLTRKSNDLYGTALMATVWERQFFQTPELDHVRLLHNKCGHVFSPVVNCSQCEMPVSADQVTYFDGPGATRDVREKKVRRRSSISIMQAPSSKALYKNLIHIVGDRWTSNIIALAYHGLKRFDEFHAELPVATNILSDRLKFLVEEGVFAAHPYSTKPPRHEYQLTVKGSSMYPFFITLLQWGDRWCGDGNGVPMIPRHLSCGFDLKANVCCDQCNQVLEAHDVSFSL